MEDNVDAIKKSLVVLTSTLQLLVNQIANEGSTDTSSTNVPEEIEEGLVGSQQISSQPKVVAASSLTPSAAVIRNKRHSDDIRQLPVLATTERRQVHPKVVIGKSNRTRQSQQQISQLQSRAATVSWEDGELESRVPHPVAVAEESSGDELLHDTPQPVRPTKPTKPSRLSKATRLPKPKRPSEQAKRPRSIVASKSAGRAVRIKAPQPAQLEPIEWVFWVQDSEEVGSWRLLSELPNTTQSLFKHKFSDDFLEKPRHLNLFATMLSRRDVYLHRDICVGNMTYWTRNEPSTWKIAGGNKNMTCDTCLRAGRFCARMVEVGGVVKLGFFPVPGAINIDWKELGYWAGKQKEKKRP